MEKQNRPKISVITPTIRGIDALKRVEEGLKKQQFRDFEWIIKISNVFPNGSDLNASYNQLIRASRGELIVFIQDYIEPNPAGLEKFWHAYIHDSRQFLTAPVKFENKDWDWRKYRQEYESCTFAEWEINWAAAPKSALIEIGGFDEELDKFWGFDNVNVGLRATMAGYEITNLPDNPAFGIDHEELIEHPYRKLRNTDFHNGRLHKIKAGLKIKYL